MECVLCVVLGKFVLVGATAQTLGMQQTREQQMPLTWDATKVEGWDAFDEMDSSIMGNYCFVLMAIGIGKVTPENVGEVVFRTRMVQGIVGNLLTGKTTEQSKVVADKLESVEFVSRLIGFYANIADEAWSTWSRRVHNIHAGEFQGKAKRLLEVVPA